MRIQSKATDRAIVSVRPETDPKNQTGESALVNSTYTKTGTNNVNHYPPKRAKDYLILKVSLAFTCLIRMKTPTSWLQIALVHTSILLLLNILQYQIVPGSQQFKNQNQAEFTKAMSHNIVPQPMRNSVFRFGCVMCPTSAPWARRGSFDLHRATNVSEHEKEIWGAWDLQSQMSRVWEAALIETLQ